MAITNPNIADRHDRTFFTGPIGNGTHLTGPLVVTDGSGNVATVAAAATDATSTQALANSLRSALIQLGIVTAS